MARLTRKPHVLVDVDSDLTRRLWRGLESAERPFLICANPLAPSIGLARTASGEAYRIGSSLEGLIEGTLQGSDDPEALAYLVESLGVVRRHFGLRPDARLNVALVGSHSSVSGNADGAHANRGDYLGSKSRGARGNAMRRGRTFAGLVDALLDELGGFDPIWLTDAFPGLLPGHRPSAYDALADVARKRLATIRIPPFEGVGRPLRRPAMPLLYVTEETGEPDRVEWRPLATPDPDRPRSVTQALLRQFGVLRRRSDGRLRGVLVKLLPDRLDGDGGLAVGATPPTRAQNRLDAPMIGFTTIADADEAGIEAILLDARHGVVRDPLDEAVRRRLVYGCLPPG